MSDALNSRLEQAPVVPLVAPRDLAADIRVIEALMEGGLGVIEVILRTPQALDLLPELIRQVPDAIMGAGTVLDADQARKSIDAGSQFIVSPGLSEEVVTLCQQAGVPVFPGIATASELMTAHRLGLQAVKFFPASLIGGPPMLKAMSSVFAGMKFMPTGGISTANLSDYLALPSVLACGGSWLTPRDAIDSGEFSRIRELASEAVEIARVARQ